MSQKLIISNVIYGPTYSDIFLNTHLTSLLDDSNLPQVKSDVSFIFYTDVETKPVLEKHHNMMKLLSLCEVEIRDFTWHGNADRFGRRYDLLINSFRQCAEEAIKRECLLSPLTADHVFAKNCLPMLLEKQEEGGHDAVLMLPPRAAAEKIRPFLDKNPGAYPSHELWRLCKAYMHPLNVHCHWDSPLFTQYPFTLLWSSQKGMLAHSYSITPLIMRPTKKMAETRRVVDAEVPGMFKNPYWVKDWDEIPMIATEPILCYYPPFTKGEVTGMRAGEWIRDWSACLDKSQLKHLRRPIYFPNRKEAEIPQEVEMQAEMIVRTLTAHEADHGKDT